MFSCECVFNASTCMGKKYLCFGGNYHIINLIKKIYCLAIKKL